MYMTPQTIILVVTEPLLPEIHCSISLTASSPFAHCGASHTSQAYVPMCRPFVQSNICRTKTHTYARTTTTSLAYLGGGGGATWKSMSSQLSNVCRHGWGGGWRSHCLEWGRWPQVACAPLSAPENLTRGHDCTTSQVRVSGTGRDTF